MSYSQLKPLQSVFGLVREAANQHTLNDYDGIGPMKDPDAGRRRTRAQFLSFAQNYGIDATRKLLNRFEITNK